MLTIEVFGRFWQGPVLGLAIFAVLATASADAAEKPSSESQSADEAASEEQMQPYTETIRDTDVTFDMVPIPGGDYLMGSPPDEFGHKDDEAPQHKVRVDPFWMGKHEVTWNEYDIWSFSLDIQRRKLKDKKPTKKDKKADAVTRPTKPYTDMTFDMGHDDYPAICMTQLAAKMYCKWLSAKTGHYYRLPTEAEWEYACRAGTQTAYSFGDDPKKLGKYAWYYENSDNKYHKVGGKKPNPWGLHDIHGNVAEWVLDQYIPDFYEKFADQKKPAEFPLAVPTTLYPRVVRGGSWQDDAEKCRSAARAKSDSFWKIQDPQIPQSIWYHTDALHVGFRVVRPLDPRSPQVRKKLKLDPVLPEDDDK